ncbi:hypothetical protein [Isoptericola croceus]|uniref:hypothetical protein n=1 Tax=Isoptericola croceus TaxID=3031406 RepID=UPI0023F927BD|nr:hypothetical protein [Isoptericola croceus]
MSTTHPSGIYLSLAAAAVLAVLGVRLGLAADGIDGRTIGACTLIVAAGAWAIRVRDVVDQRARRARMRGEHL